MFSVRIKSTSQSQTRWPKHLLKDAHNTQEVEKLRVVVHSWEVQARSYQCTNSPGPKDRMISLPSGREDGSPLTQAQSELLITKISRYKNK